MNVVLHIFIHSAFFLYHLANNVFSQNSKCPSGNSHCIVFLTVTLPILFLGQISSRLVFLIIPLQRLTDITRCYADVTRSMRYSHDGVTVLG